ncbi:MAG TPA: hypothetical protein VGQ90_10650, partial [Stellaceae bacterium]|nr:hypothetical protein [Stellaceae bacterium]
MTGTVYTGAYYNGIVLSNATLQNPATIAASGYIGNTGTSHNGDAIFGAVGTAWTVVNEGTIVSNGTIGLSYGVDLRSGGAVVNEATGSITGQAGGI